VDEESGEVDEDGEAGLLPVDQLICPMAAHGGAIFT
jgi:hypothetical protein